MNTVTPEQVSAFRLQRHHLDQRAPRHELVTVAGDLGGVQAQVMSAAQIALWARVQDLTPEDVERALWQERTLVKTWSLRGTVHLVPATDLWMHVNAMGPRGIQVARGWMARDGVNAAEAQAMTDAIVQALADGPLSRKELADRVVALLGGETGETMRQWLEHGWGGLVKQACHAGLVCFAPGRGQEVAFVRCEQWLPNSSPQQPAPALSREQAIAALLRRYLHAYGPATPQDLGLWAGLTMAELGPVWQRIAVEMVEVSVEGREGWLLEKDLATLQSLTAPAQNVRLLPNFDTYLLGHKDRRHLVGQAHYKKVYRNAGWISAVVLVEGRIAGVWSYQRRGKRLLVTIEPFGALPGAIRAAVEAEAADLGRFLGAISVVNFGE